MKSKIVKQLEELVGFDQRKYIEEYNKQTYRKYAFRVRFDNADVIEHLEKQDSISGYINSLIEEDMKKKVD